MGTTSWEARRQTTALNRAGDRRRGGEAVSCSPTNKSCLSSDPLLPRRTHFLLPWRLCKPTAEARKQPGLCARDKTITINLGSSQARRQTPCRLDSVTGSAGRGLLRRGPGQVGGGGGLLGGWSIWPASDGPHYGCRLAPLLRGLATE